MREETIDIEPWRRVRLGDEPIYCAAPPPASPNDILYVGSDEELDDNAKIAKRLRYEAQGLRYLQGKPLRIMTASLRGPFDRASGWKNPWLPKPKQQPAIKKSTFEPSQLPIRRTPLVNRRLSKDDATPRTGDSLQCHLPSPQSNLELHLSNSPLEKKKRRRIQAWADGVILERDAFWAPKQTLHETDEHNKKRPAEKEWLKKEPSKRKRFDVLQDAPAVSSPSPIPPMKSPIQSVPVPIQANQTIKPAIPNIISNSKSFELGTPSSLSQSGHGVLGEVHVEICTRSETTPSPDESLDNLGLAADDSDVEHTSTTSDGIYDPSSADGQECEQGPDFETQGYSKSASNHTSPKALQAQGTKENIVLESYMDQSFHYRARPPKQASPIIDPDVPITDVCSELTQTGTSESPSHEDAVTILTQGKETELPKTATVAEQQVDMEPEVKLTASEHLSDPIYETEKSTGVPGSTNNSSIPATLDKEGSKNEGTRGGDDELSRHTNAISRTVTTETRLSENERDPVHDNPIADNSFNSSIFSVAISALRKLSELTAGQNLDTGYDDPHMIVASLQAKATQTAIPQGDSTAVETNLAKPGPWTDEGSTLVGYPTDCARSTPSETGELLAHQVVPAGSNTEAIPTSEPHIATQNVIEEASQEDDSDSESNLVIVPLSQSEWGIEVMEDSPKKLDTPNEDRAKTPTIKVEEDLECHSPVQNDVLDTTEIGPQSPWVRELSPGADLTSEYIKAEPTDGEYSLCSFQPIAVSSQVNTHETPIIRPSQQTPWTEEHLESVTLDQQSRYPTTLPDATLTGKPSIGGIPQEHQSPWTEMNTNVMSPKDTPGLLIPTISDELSQSPIPPPADTESGHGSPESPTGNPSTPHQTPTCRLHTPDLEDSIKPFALLNTPSPKGSPQQSTRQRLSTGRSRGILSSGIHSRSRARRRLSERPSRRVSFALLPNERDDTLPPITSTTRAASPPPETVIGTEDEDVDNLYQKHFDAVRRRASGENVRLRLQPRLLPSSSQQKPISPTINAMAQAFREADAHVVQIQPDPIQDIATEAEECDQEMSDAEQSPWQKDSQGVDEVAQVLDNLDEYLNAWDVDAELQNVKGESSTEHCG
ncbi:hypothetical protein F5Y04DRAFT_245432 [Hypomontagnella monticulosa]|nr:hypothetical protein F5Y04DRAFT_245432 [Hypomontagnella monticulosa]